jgi:3-hydroxyacyl-CoA dehydrogenase
MALFFGRPQNFVGIYFFHPPVQVMKLVEVIRTEHTDPAVFDKVSDVGKVPTLPGLSSIACLSRVSSGPCQWSIVTTPRSRTLILPLHLSDYIGLDTCLFIIQGGVEKYPDEPCLVIPKCLEEKVAAGDLGRKSGKGFYNLGR